MSSLEAWLDQRPPWLISCLCLLVIVAVGWIDLVTGTEVGISIFYAAPIALAGWYIGRRSAIAFAFVSAGVWYLALSGAQSQSAAVPVWNALVRFGFFLVIALLVSGNRALVDKLRALAVTDPATDLANSRAFIAAVDREIGRHRRAEWPMTIAYIDVDDFKLINDTWGHLAGDYILHEAAARMKASVRRGDLIARLGGDEFGILLPQTGMKEAAHVLRRLRDVLGEPFGGEMPGISASVGGAVFHPPPDSVDEAIGKADALMYEVKFSAKGALRIEEV